MQLKREKIYNRAILNKHYYRENVKLFSSLAAKAQEKIVSRVLCHAQVAPNAVMIIHLGRQLPAASSDTTREHQAGSP